MDADILNLEQAMEFFGVSERTMIKLLREEHIPARKIGREWRFSRTALLDWLGRGDSVNYQSQVEQYRVACNTSSTTPDLLGQISTAVDTLQSNGLNVRSLLPEMEEDVSLPDSATLRTCYKRDRGVEKLAFKISWPIRN